MELVSNVGFSEEDLLICRKNMNKCFISVRSTHNKIKKFFSNKENRKKCEEFIICPEGYGKIANVKKDYIVIRTNKKFRLQAEDNGKKFISDFIIANVYNMIKYVDEDINIKKKHLNIIFDYYFEDNKLIIEF